MTTLAFDAVLGAQGFLNGISQMLAGITNLKSQAAGVSNSLTWNTGSIRSGLSKSLSGDFAQVGSQLGNAITGPLTAGLGSMGGVAGAAAQALGPVGIAALAGTAAVVGLGAASISAASNWEAGLSKISKTTGIDKGTADFNTLDTGLKNLMTTMPTTVQEIQSVASAAGSLGIAKGDIASFTGVALQMGSAFDMPADEAATSIAKIQAQFPKIKTSASEFGLTFGSVVDTMGNNFAASEKEVMNFSVRTASSMAMLGGSVNDVAGFGGKLISTFPSAELAAGSFNSLVTNMTTNDKAISESSKLLGVTREEYQKMMASDPSATILAVGDAMAKLPQEAQTPTAKIIGGAYGDDALKRITQDTNGYRDALGQARIAAYGAFDPKIFSQSEGAQQQAADLLGLSSEEFKKQLATNPSQVYMDIGRALDSVDPTKLEDMKKGLGIGGLSVEGSYGRSVQNLAAQSKIMGNSIQAALIDIGTPFLAPLAAAAGGITTIINVARQAGEAIYGIVTKSQAVSAIGGMFSAIGGAAQAAFSNLASIVSPAFEAMGGGSAVMSALGTAFNAATAPITLLATGVKLAAQGLTALISAAAPVASALGSGLGNAVKQAVDGFERGKATVQAFIAVLSQNSAIQAFTSAMKGAADVAGKVWDGVKDAVPKALDGAFNAAKELIQKFIDWLGTTPIGKLLGVGAAGASDITDNAKNMMLAPFQGLISAVQGKADEIYNAAHPAGEEAAKGVAKGIDDNKANITKSIENGIGGTEAKAAAAKSAQELATEFTKVYGSQFEAGMSLINGKWISNQESAGFNSSPYTGVAKIGDFTYTLDKWNLKLQTPTGEYHFSSTADMMNRFPQIMKDLIGRPLENIETANLMQDTATLMKMSAQVQIEPKMDLANVFKFLDQPTSGPGYAQARSYAQVAMQEILGNAMKEGSPKAVQEAAKNFSDAFGSVSWANLPGMEKAGAELEKAYKNFLLGTDKGNMSGGDVIKQAMQNYKAAIQASIYDAKTYAAGQLEGFGSMISDALASGVKPDQALVPKLNAFLDWLKTTYPDQFKAVGGESWQALSDAIASGDTGAIKAAAEACGLLIKEGIISQFGGIGEAITSEVANARAGLKSNEVFQMLYGGTPEDQAKAKTWIADNVADTSKWYRSHFESAAKGWQQDAETYGMKVPDSFWNTLKSQWEQNGDWFDKDLSARMAYLDSAIKNYYGSWDNFTKNASLDRQIEALKFLQDETDKATEKAKSQSVGYDNLKKTMEDCADCAISDFGKWQEAQDNLFQGSYIGPGGTPYEQWKTSQIQAIAETQAAVKRMGGVAVGKDYTQQWSELQKLKIDTTEADTKVQATQSAVGKLLADTKEGATLTLDTTKATSNFEALISSIQAQANQTIYVETVHYDTYAGSSGGTGAAGSDSWADSYGGSWVNPNLEAVIPGYAEGISFVPDKMLAILHPGERVLTAEENKGYGNAGNTYNFQTFISGEVGDPDAWQSELDKRDEVLRREFKAADMKLAKAQ